MIFIFLRKFFDFFILANRYGLNLVVSGGIRDGLNIKAGRKKENLYIICLKMEEN